MQPEFPLSGTLAQLTERAFAAIPNGVVITDAQQQGNPIIYCNPGFVRLTGYDPQEILGRNCRFLQGSETDLATVAEIRAAIRAARSYQGVIKNYRKDGTSFWNELNIGPIYDAAGHLTHFVGVQTNVTARVVAETALRASEERFAKAFYASPVAISISTLEAAQFLAVNDQFVQLSGYERDEIVGNTALELELWANPAERSKILQLFQTHNRVRYAASEFRRKSGEIRHVIVSIERIQVDHEAALLTLFEDVTERKQAEAALRASEARLQTVIANLPVVLFALDRHGVITLSEGKGLAALGIASGQSVGQSIIDQYAHLPGGLESFQSVLRGNEARWSGWVADQMLEIYLTPIREADGQISGVLGLALDVTERQRAEQERQTIERKMFEAQHLESLGVLAGGIAHDFNNLLTVILGNTNLALLDLPAESDSRESVVQVERAAQRAADLTQQLLAYAGKGRTVVQPVQIIEEMTHLLETVIPKQVVLHTDLDPSIPPVQADATQLRQVVMNLVLNAAEAIDGEVGHVTITTGTRWIDRAALAEMHHAPDVLEGYYVALAITDTGQGMDAATRAKIFEPFFTTKFKGRGLGLAAVLGIVRGHGGALHVVSEPGSGSTFTLVLPSTTTPALHGISDTNNSEQWRGQGTILVIEDEAEVRAVISRTLEQLGFTVLTAIDGQAGVDVFRNHADALAAVLLDATMPRMSGPDAFREIHRLLPTVPVVLMSGYNEQEVVEQLAEQGLAGFLHKPFQPGDFQVMLQQVLAQR